VTKKYAGKRSAVIVVCLTKKEKTALEEFARGWDVDMALVARRLIQYLIRNRVSLPELLQKHHVESAFAKLKNKAPKSRTCRLGIRIRQEEKQALIVLADRGFYLPGEAARILLILFITGVIKKNDIWE
jgi:hypothetical protein